MDTPFILEHIYPAKIDQVWQALTNEDQMRSWYFPQILRFEPVVGFRFQFKDDDANYKKEWLVTKVISGKLLTHSQSYIGYPGNSEVTFELSEIQDSTRLKVTHTGLESFPHDPHFARNRFEEGWNRIIGTKLKEHLKSNF